MGEFGRQRRREAKTVWAMIRMYCRAFHGGHVLCEECRDLGEYAWVRLSRCPFGDEKPTCANCPIHCYRPDYREQIREVMRYSGPRMLFHHPLLAIFHLLHGRKPAPTPPRSSRGAQAAV